MITLTEYKRHLIEVHRYPIDNEPENIKHRIESLARQYNDDYLTKIINDTYDFILDVLNSKTISHGYCKFELEEDKTQYISLNMCGGFSSDIIYKDMQDRLISSYIMKLVFGNRFHICVRTDEESFEDENDEDLYGFNVYYSLYMQGFPNNLKEIKEQLFGKSIELKK